MKNHPTLVDIHIAVSKEIPIVEQVNVVNTIAPIPLLSNLLAGLKLAKVRFNPIVMVII